MVTKHGLSSPDLNVDGNKRLRLAENDTTKHLEYKSTSACFQVQIDPDVQLDDDDAVNPYDKDVPEHLQLATLTVGPGKSGEFTKLCFRSAYWACLAIHVLLSGLRTDVGNVLVSSQIYCTVQFIV